MVFTLPFFGEVKRPLVYLRDCRIEVIAARIQSFLPEARFFWWKTGRIRQIDLIVVTPAERIGICFSAVPSPPARAWRPLDIAYRRGVINRGFLLHAGDQRFVVARVVRGLAFSTFLHEAAAWISA